jgi:hypothetical protein
MRGRLVIGATGLAIAATAGGIAVAGTPASSPPPTPKPTSASSGPVAGPKTPEPQPPDQGVVSLARILHVSQARAGQVLDALDGLGAAGNGVDARSPGFARLAASLGRTPAQLAGALAAWKLSLAHRPPSPPPAQPTPVKKSPHR